MSVLTLRPVRWLVGPREGLIEPQRTYIEIREQPDGTQRYAVCRFGRVLNREGQWELEPIPSDRTQEFIDRTRYNSLAGAFDVAKARLTREGVTG
jgi:hypothetical protein